MPTTWQTVRVFISSTFRDMHAERDHLVRFVFPRLREELLKRRIHLVDVDLRWGVTSEQDALEVCRNIIDECRPRFMCILGGRYGWTPPGQERSITADEVQYAVMDRLGQHGQAYFYFRDPQATESIPDEAARKDGYREFPQPDEIEDFGLGGAQSRADERGEKLVALKDAITRAGLNPFVYPAKWSDEQQRLVRLERFGERVHADLLASIEAELGTQPPEQLDEFTEEIAAMEAFVAERVERYVVGSRVSVLDRLTAFADGDGEPNVLVITGAPGSGKSALLGKFFQDFSETHPNDLVVPHFVGASARSTDLRRTLRRLCHDLGIQAESIPEDVKELTKQFSEQLRQASKSQRVVLVIDALNQMDATDNAHALYWMPQQFPANVRVIVSSLEHRVLEELRRRLHTSEGSEAPEAPRRLSELKIEPLTQSDARAIVEGVLQRYHKRMSGEQVDLLLAKADSGNPLYLRTALEELRTLGTYEEMTDRIRQLKERTQDLFHWILTDRLSNDPGFRDAEGSGVDLVRKFVSLIAVSRHGLSQLELVGVIAPGDPHGNVAALQRLLRPYLMTRGELLDFYHGQFREAVAAEYLDEVHEPPEAHRQLADFFHRRLNPESGEPWSGDYPRALKELPYHQTRGEDWGAVESTICDLRFIKAKCMHGMTFDLVQDYADTLEALPEREAEREQERQRQESLRRYDQALIRYAQEHEQGCQLPNPPNTGPVLAAMRRSKAVAQADSDLVDDERRDVRIQRYASFASSHSHNLQSHPDLTVAQARNHASAGEIVQQADRLLSGLRKPWISRDPRPPAPPITPVCIRTLIGHNGTVQAVALTSDGKTALSASSDKAIRVWDVQTGACIRTLEGHSDYVSAVVVTPDSKSAVSASWDGTVRVWEVSTGVCIRTLEGHSGYVNAVTVSADGKNAISAGDDKTLCVWDVSTGTCARTLTGHINSVTTVAITPDGKTALSGSIDQTVRVWDVPSGICIRTLQGHENWVFAVAMTPDGKFAVSSSGHVIPKYDNTTVRVWDLQSGTCIKTLSGHSRLVWGLAITPNGKNALSASEDETIRVWDLQTGKCVETLEGHTEKVTAVAITPDFKFALSGSGDETVRVWNLHTGTSKQRTTIRVKKIAMTADGNKSLSVSFDGGARLWDTQTGTYIGTLMGHSEAITAVAISPDGKYALSGSGDKTVRVWDIRNGTCIRILEGHSNVVSAVAITADGKYGLSACADKILRVWNVNSGECLCTLDGHTDWVSALALTPDGNRAVSASGDNTLRVWDAQNGNYIRTLEGHSNSVSAVAMTPDGKFTLSASYDKTVRVWDMQTGRCIKTLEGHILGVTAVAITPDGKNGISASHDMTLRTWDLKTGEMIAAYACESDGLSVVMISNNRFAAGTASGQIHFLTLRNYP